MKKLFALFLLVVLATVSAYAQTDSILVSCPVRIVTVPARALITIDNSPGMLAEDFVMLEGKHRIRIEKSGYERRDTTIVLDSNDACGVKFSFNLKPQFSCISVIIKAAEGCNFNSEPTLDISGIDVDLRPGSFKSFNVDQDISYYSLYDGNIIPLHPGQYIIKAAAKGFVAEKKNIFAECGSTKTLEFILAPVTGTLSVSDEGNAMGADVYVDGKRVGTVPCKDIAIKTGKHNLHLEKPNYITDDESYEIEILEDENTEFRASMQGYRKYSIDSKPAGINVYLDEILAGTAPMELVVRDGDHVIRYDKAGYYPQTILVNPLKDIDTDLRPELENAYPFLVSADKDSLRITITHGEGPGTKVYVEGVKTPAKVFLPLKKKPYSITLTRYDSKVLYKGNFTFNRQANNELKILTWTEGMPILSVNAFINPLIRPAEGENALTLAYIYHYNTNSEGMPRRCFDRVGDASLMPLRLLPGLTTNLAKATLFAHIPSDRNDKIVYYEGKPTDNSTHKPLDLGAAYKDVVLLPAFSALLINGEFRVGGAMLPFMDGGLLASYAWYPDIRKLVGFTHMSGHDIFVGAEFSTRIKIINVNLKAGAQMFFGKANIYIPGSSKEYIQEGYNDSLKFAFTLGFSLGGGRSRGQNILRVF